MITPTEKTFELELDIDRRSEGDQMYLIDTEIKEKPLCRARVSVHYLTGVDDYLERGANKLLPSTICSRCKSGAVKWAENHCPKLEADASELRARAGKLEAVAVDCLAEAEATAVEWTRRKEMRRVTVTAQDWRPIV